MKTTVTNDQMKQTGVYCILNLVNGKRYIGSAARSFGSRLAAHYSRLLKKKHHSTYLQNSWNKYGDHVFEFRILRITSPEDAVSFEQVFIDLHKTADPRFGFNASPIAGSPLGVTRSEKERKAISERSKKQFADPAARKRASDAAKKRFSDPEARRINGERIAATARMPEKRAIASKNTTAYFSDPERRRIQGEKVSAICGLPEQRAANKARMKKYYSNPESHELARVRCKKRMEDPAERQRVREATKAFYADPVRREAKMQKGRITRANKKLVILQEQS